MMSTDLRARAGRLATRMFAPRPPPPQFRHPDSLLTLEQTATDRRYVTPYQKTYKFPGTHINDEHAGLGDRVDGFGMIDLGIAGWLLPADAWKLYELAYFAAGDVLELGTYHGLSAHVIRRAIVASGRRRALVSIDTNRTCTEAGKRSIEGQPGAENVLFFTTTADEALESHARIKKRFDFCFIDHSHTYAHVRSACERLASVLRPGSFCLFHDYNDKRNADPANADYGVYQAVSDALPPAQFEQWGVYGCTGLFRFTG